MAEEITAELPPINAPPAKRLKAGNLLWQALGAVLWGVFFSVTPIFDILVPGAVLWIPLFIWLEARRARKYGLLPGLFLRIAIIATMISAAIYLPTKPEDRKIVEGLSKTTVTLAELSRHAGIRVLPEHADVSVILPSTQPTLRQVIRAIETQTPLRCEVGRCGNGVTFLGGAYIMGIGIR